MADHVLSRRAALDLQDIADYGFANFGAAKAREYGSSLENCFERLAVSPGIGVAANDLATGLRRFKVASHWVFYAEQENGVFIVRVLHERMDFVRHL